MPWNGSGRIHNHNHSFFTLPLLDPLSQLTNFAVEELKDCLFSVLVFGWQVMRHQHHSLHHFVRCLGIRASSHPQQVERDIVGGLVGNSEGEYGSRKEPQGLPEKNQRLIF